MHMWKCHCEHGEHGSVIDSTSEREAGVWFSGRAPSQDPQRGAGNVLNGRASTCTSSWVPTPEMQQMSNETYSVQLAQTNRNNENKFL